MLLYFLPGGSQTYSCTKPFSGEITQAHWWHDYNMSI